LLLSVAGCTGEAPSSAEAFRNLDLTSTALDGRAVELTDGRAVFVDEGIEVVLDELLLTGTLDGGEGAITAGFLYTNREGEFSEIELVVASEVEGEMRHLDSFLLGGPFRVEGIRYEAETILVYLLDYAADDPPCCPTLSLQRRFHVVDGQLREVEVVDPIEAGAETPA
jgi:hypothetical protein